MKKHGDGSDDPAFGALPFRLTVPYSCDLSEAVAHGKYDTVDPSLLKYFDGGRMHWTSGYAFLLSYPGCLVHAKWICKAIHGLRVADIEELLAFGAQYPEVQRRFPIVGLGSMCKIGQEPGVWQAAYLVGDEKERRVGLAACNFHYGDRFRFLVIELPGWQ